MPIPKVDFSYVELGGCLFVLGGRTKPIVRQRPFNLVECYNPLTDTWKSVAPMLHQRISATACTLNGFIYVFRGRDKRGQIQESIEIYDPVMDSWLEVSSILLVLCGYFGV